MKIEPEIYVIITDDNSGTNPFTFVTAEERDAKFAEYCKSNWFEENGPMPDDPYEAYETVSESGSHYAYIYDLSFEQHPLFLALGHLLKEVVQSNIDGDGNIALPLNKKSDLRARIHRALGIPIDRKDILHGSDLDRDTEDEPIVWRNRYKCGCGEEWTDDWSCQCDDRCPTCDTSVGPIDSEWIGPDEDEEQTLFWEAVSDTETRASNIEKVTEDA